MSDAAGNINIILSVNKANYTQAMQEAQRQLDVFAGKTRSAGHGSTSSIQAVSASLRAMHGGFENNIRSVERWISQSKTATMVAKTMFPVIAGVTFGVMILDLGKKVYDFIQTANAMPKAIASGFQSMRLSAMSSTDALRETNDQLQNSINKLQGKPQNNLAIVLDDARKAADKLATSLENDDQKVKALLKDNHISGLSSLMDKAPTSSVAGSVNSYNDKLKDLGYQKAQRFHEGNTGAADELQKQIDATRQSALAWAADQLKVRDNAATFQGNVYGGPVYQDMAGDQTGNRNILRGFQGVMQDQTDEETEEKRHSTLAPQKANLDAQKAASEAAKKAAHDRVAAMQTQLDAMKLQYSMSIKATYDYWELKKSTFLSGSTGYNDIVKKQSELAVQAATEAHAKIQQAIANTKRGNAQDATIGPDIINQSARFMQGQAVKTGSEQTQGYVDSNQLAIEQASNAARVKEAQINDAAGKSITRYAAAVQLANVHTQEYITTQMALQAILDSRIADQKANPSQANARAVTNAQIALSNSQVQRGLQITSDANNANPPATSMSAGFADAINDFVNASQDGAEQMRGLVTNTLQGLNQQIIGAMSGQKTNFKQFGSSVFRSVAGTALGKGEGELLGAFGGGKLGASQSNPMWVKVAGSSGSASAASSMFSSMAGSSGSDSDGDSSSGSSAMGTFAGIAMQMLPMLATGGPIDGPAIVGEAGPELYIPHTSGTIIPNHKLSAMTNNTTGHTINIDASGSTDPAQTRVQVMRGIQAAAPHIAASTINAQREQNLRKPPSARK